MKKAVAIMVLAITGGLVAGQSQVQAEDSVKSILTDMTHVQRWNRFADKLLALHNSIISRHKVRTTESIGGYFREPDFYKDVHYYDADSGRLLSHVQWETKHPDRVHFMEIYEYDSKGRVIRDYGVAYLTEGRNAPVQTLINFHAYPKNLHAFRQFDASNNLIFERCDGTYKGKEVHISLSEMDILNLEDQPKSLLTSPQYKKCFSGLPRTAGKYLTPQLQ
jgi:hypothetical protein